MEPATRRQLGGVVLLGGCIAAGTLLLSPRHLASAVAALADRPLVFAVGLLLAYLLRPVVAWPISVVSAAVGYALGPAGVPVALAGAVLTCLPPYLLARRLGHDTGLLGSVGEAGSSYFAATGGLRGVVAVRLAPLPADPVSYTAGLARVPLGAYALGTAVGELPWVTAAALVGASAETVTTEGLHVGLPAIVGATALALLVLSGPLYRVLSDRGRPAAMSD